MECNKDEANRAINGAELLFAMNYLVNAKEFIRKALELYPCLKRAIQLSAILDVHIAAQVKVGINEPEPDYYGILQVEPLSDDSTIKKQYRNLSKLVHPDKNKESLKAKSEDAFKLIAKAYGVLSDKATRSQHDSKRGEKPTANPTPAPGAEVSQAPNAFWTPASPATGAQAFRVPCNTFWTACPFCRMQYQYIGIFLNSQVVCQNCRSSFPANDISVHPANGASAFVWTPGPEGNSNPFLAGAAWYQMYQNHLAPPYGASTNGTSWNDLRPILRGANLRETMEAVYHQRSLAPAYYYLP